MAWNRPQTDSQANDSLRRGRTPRPTVAVRRAALATLVCVVVAGAVWWFWPTEDRAGETPPPRAKSRIKVVTPAAAVKPSTVSEEEPKREKMDDNLYRDEDGILRFKNSGNRAYDPTVKHRSLNPASLERQVFSNAAERAIASLLEAVPGGISFTNPEHYSSPEFQAILKASFDSPIVIGENDTPEDAALKQEVSSVKEDLHKRLMAGEDVSQVFIEAERDLAKLRRYREDVEKMAKEAVENANGELSDTDISDLVKAANLMLEEKGVSPISPDSFVTANIRLMALRNGEDPKAKIAEHYQKIEEQNLQSEQDVE